MCITSRRAPKAAAITPNLISVCAAHHRALHRGELTAQRGGSSGVRFSHADGSSYGGATNPEALDLMPKVSAALRNLGFRESDARCALDELRNRDDLQCASLQDWLRAALVSLTPATR